MTTEFASVTACPEYKDKKTQELKFIVHCVSEKNGCVYRAFSDTHYPVGDQIEIIPNYPRFGSAEIFER